MKTKSDVPVFLLCGGLGTRFKEETVKLPKPMVPVGIHPILWHIMQSYSYHGFQKFVICLGYKATLIKDYFLNYSSLNSDFSINLKTNNVTIHSVDHNEDWDVTLVFTGEKNMTGSRLHQAITKYLGASENFAVSYGDGLTNANLGEEFKFHKSQGKIGTILGVNPPSRFGELKVENDCVIEFAEKPEFKEKWINGGYMFFKRDFLEYLSDDENCILEREPLVKLANDGQMSLFKHPGYWACMDTKRDYDQINTLWDSGEAPWEPINLTKRKLRVVK